MLLKVTKSSAVVIYSFSKALMEFPYTHAHAPPNKSPIVIVKTLFCLTKVK
jgi:hypothetical protein